MTRSMMGMQMQVTCFDCQGTGGMLSNPCSGCGGDGRQQKVLEKKITIPKGVDSGTTIRVSGGGNYGMSGGENGDLFVRLHVKRDPNFIREGSDVFTKQTIDLKQALLGDQIRVKGISGDINMKVPPGTNNNTTLRLSGKGIKHVNTNKYGDHFVEFKVVLPRNLNSHQKNLVRELCGYEVVKKILIKLTIMTRKMREMTTTKMERRK